MPIIGTAGHVDHGKSTLVAALTGRDPDRLAEEKRRGLTIDLGFAWMTLPDGTEVGFVDVPGHERFIKNMLAGAGGIDVALLVVAADEGWMPQSEEHLAVLDLLEIRLGVVALTRVDLVPDPVVESRRAEIVTQLDGTSLAGAAVVAVATPVGTGLAELADQLSRLVAAMPSRRPGRPRLWVDRSFSIAGAGRVVTGTLLGGRLQAGGPIAAWPGGAVGRVRSLQSHEREVAEVGPGTRVAVNLAGLDRVPRGAMLGEPGAWRTTRRIVADLRPVRGLTSAPTRRGAYHLHAGTVAARAQLLVIEQDSLSAPGAALIDLGTDLPLTTGDPIILRDVGRRAVVAGGRVLDPAPPSGLGPIRAALPVLRAAGPEPGAGSSALLAVRGIEDAGVLFADSGGRPETAIPAGRWLLHPAERDRLAAAVAGLARAYHDQNPLRPGLPAAEAASRLGVDRTVVEAVTAGTDEVHQDGAVLRAAGFSPGLDADGRGRLEELVGRLEAEGLRVPRVADLGTDPEFLHLLLRTGRLVRISPEFVYTPGQIDRIHAAVEILGAGGAGFTVAQFRDALGVTRKYAVPLVEWLDRTGVTSRSGDLRVVRRRPSPGRDAGGAPPQ